MNFIPRPYQEEAVDHLQENDHALLWADMGLGKTAICLYHAYEMMKELAVTGVLIVAPLRVMRLTWPMELEKWSNFKNLNMTLLHGKDKLERLNGPQKHFYVINYEGLMWLAGELQVLAKQGKPFPFNMLIWDELTQIKSHGSKRYKAWKKHLGAFDYRIGMTGTPQPNSMLELFGQTFMVDGGKRLGTAFTRYQRRFFQATDYMQFNWEIREGCAEKIHELLGDIAITFETEGNVDLPPCTVTDINVSLPAGVRKGYKELEKEMFVKLEGGEDVEVMSAAALTNKCLQYSGGAVYVHEPEEKPRWVLVHGEKIKALQKLVKSLKDQPVLVAYTYQHERDRIMEAFPYAEVFKSGLSEAKEVDLLKRWNQGKVRMLVCHPKSTGHGLNLQDGGCHAVWFSLNWSLELTLQLNKRLHRSGQKNPVTIYRIITKDTVDEVVATTLENKNKGQNELLSAIEMYKRNLS